MENNQQSGGETQQPTPTPTPAPKNRTTFIQMYAMEAESVKQPGKTLRLVWGATNGYPNITADLDEHGEPTKENGWNRTSARMNGPALGEVLAIIEKAVEEQPGWEHTINNFHTYKNGEKHEHPVHVNDIRVGKDQGGRIWISVTEQGKDSVRFYFGLSKWHTLKNQNREPVDEAEVSRRVALTTVKGVGVILGSILALQQQLYYNPHSLSVDGETAKRELDNNGPSQYSQRQGGGGNNWKQRQGGGGGGGWQNRQGGGGGWQNRQGGGGGWQNRNNGGGGNWQNRNNGNQWSNQNSGGGDFGGSEG